MEKASEDSLTRRQYPIQNDAYHYHAGHLDSGNQVLMDEFYCVEFDIEGNLLAAFSRETSNFPSIVQSFMPGTISVKAFSLSELGLGIRDLPDHY